jgi:hypothetical protein
VNINKKNILLPSPSLCTNDTQEVTEQRESPNKGKRIDDSGKYYSRNYLTFQAVGRFLGKFKEIDFSEEELFQKWKEENIKVCEKLGKELSPEAEGR